MNDVSMLRNLTGRDQRIDTAESSTAAALHAPEGGGVAEDGNKSEESSCLHGERAVSVAT